VLSSGTVAGTATAKVRVYAVNYNVLRVMSGMAGVDELSVKKDKFTKRSYVIVFKKENDI
jgi:hypothetical protein